MKEVRKCEVDFCKRTNDSWRFIGRLCQRHYDQIRHKGAIQEKTCRDPNDFIDCKDHYEMIICDRKSKEIARALIDKEDKDRVSKFRWHCHSKDYVGFGNKKGHRGMFKLHRFIMNLDKTNPLEVDHINHNPLDNRKCNLRVVTRSQNQANKKSRGYCFDKRGNYWIVYVSKDGKRVFTGYTKTENEAKNLSKDMRSKILGEYNYVNTTTTSNQNYIRST